MTTPQTPAFEQAILSNLGDMFRRNSELQFSGFFDLKGVTASEHAVPTSRVFGHLFGAVIVQGIDFRLTIKLHSDMRPLLPLCARNMQTSADKISEKMVRDFLRELANLLGGAMRTDLAKCKVNAGLSLPFSSRGFDEVFFDSKESPKTFTQAVQIRWGEGAIVATQYLEILDGWNSLQPMKDYDPATPTVDEFEALMSGG